MTTHVTEPAAPDAVAGAASAPASAHPAGAARTGPRLAWIALGVIGLLAVLVFWVFEALPFMDLPAHAGLIAMRHRFASSEFEQRYFVLAPHIGPYSLFRFLGEVFVRFLGPIGAVRALATLPVVATPLALLFARRRLFADRSPTFGYLGIALSFGFMTLLGFASYLLGVAVMLVALTLWLELMVAVDDRAPDLRRREITMALVAPFVFVAHGHAFVLFLLCAALATVAAGARPRRMLRGVTLAPALSLAGWVAWVERGNTTPAGSVPVVPPLVPVFQRFSAKLDLLVTPTLLTRSGVDFVLAVAIWCLAIACAVATVRSLARASSTFGTRAHALHARALYAGAVVVTVLFLALPHTVGWFGFVDGRLVPVVLFLVFLGTRRDALPRGIAYALDVGAPAVGASITTLALVASHAFQAEAAGYREVLAKIPAGSSILNLPLDPNSDVFTAHPFIHYDKLVLADRPVLVSDVWFHQGSAFYPTAENPALRLPPSYSESNLKVIDWPAYHLADWDYVLIRTRPNAEKPHTPDSLTLEEHRGGWWLLRRAVAN